MSLRPESSVSLEIDELGEIVFAADRPGPIIHRTPEELGIPRVVPDVPERKMPSMTWADGRALSPMRAAHVKRDRRPTMQTVMKASVSESASVGAGASVSVEEPLRVIGGEPVRMPAGAVMGAEPLADFICEREKESRMRGIKGDGIGVKCAAEGCELLAYGGKLYCSAKHGWKNTYKHVRQQGVDAPKKPKAAKPHLPLRPVEIDPGRPGTASALIRAMEKIDGDAERVRIELELTAAEVGQVLAKLGPEQRDAFLSAGLRAALLG